MALGLYKVQLERINSRAFKTFTQRKTSHKLFSLKKACKVDLNRRVVNSAIVLTFTSSSNSSIIRDL